MKDGPGWFEASALLSAFAPSRSPASCSRTGSVFGFRSNLRFLGGITARFKSFEVSIIGLLSFEFFVQTRNVRLDDGPDGYGQGAFNRPQFVIGFDDGPQCFPVCRSVKVEFGRGGG